jgi:hypothetical protein
MASYRHNVDLDIVITSKYIVYFPSISFCLRTSVRPSIETLIHVLPLFIYVSCSSSVPSKAVIS